MRDHSRNKTRRSLFIVVMLMLLSTFLMASPVVEEIYLTDTIPPPPDVPGLVQDTDSTILVYYWTEPGLHVVEVSAVNDCGMSEPVFQNVSVNEWPLVELGNDTTILAGQLLVLDAGNPGCSYLWSTGETTQMITVSTTGNYLVEVSNACGSVEDNLFMEVVVGMDETRFDEINIRISGDQVIINPAGVQIEQIQIWDLAGRLLTRLPFKPVYYLPDKGTFLIRAITYDHRVFGTMVIK